MEVLTDSVALLFSVPGVSQQFVGVFLPDTSGTIIPLQQEDKDPRCYGLCFGKAIHFLRRTQHAFMCARIRCITKERKMQKATHVGLLAEEVSGSGEQDPSTPLSDPQHTHTHEHSCRICCYATRLLMDFCFD